MRRIIDVGFAIFTLTETFIILFLIETLLPTIGSEMGHLLLWLGAFIVTALGFVFAVLFQWIKNETRRRRLLVWTVIVSALFHCLIWSYIIGEFQM